MTVNRSPHIPLPNWTTSRLEKLTPKQWAHVFIPVGAAIIGGLIFPYQSYPELWNGVFIKIIYPVWVVYILASGYLLRDQFTRQFTDYKNLNSLENGNYWYLLPLS